MENKTYIVNNVGFDNVEEAIKYLNKVSKEINDKEKQEMLARIKDSYELTNELVKEYNRIYTSEQDKKDLLETTGALDDFDNLVDKMMDSLIEEIGKELGFDE